MKHILIITIASIFVVLGISFLIFNIQMSSIIGFATYNDSSTNIINDSDKIVNEKIITREDALLAINESEQIIKEMQANNFSALYMQDALIEAKMVFEQVGYAEILRGNSTEAEKQLARQALRLVKWNNITYRDVLEYTNKIKERENTAFLLADQISVESAKINNDVSEETKQVLNDAKIAFNNDRYEETKTLLEQFKIAVEQDKTQISTLSGIKNGAKNFFQRYRVYILIFLIVLGIISYFSYKRFEKKILISKIRKTKTEEQVLMNLMKKTQTERFKENKISGLVYNIRMKKYQERLQEIKEELPVLEERARRFKK